MSTAINTNYSNPTIVSQDNLVPEENLNSSTLATNQLDLMTDQDPEFKNLFDKIIGRMICNFYIKMIDGIKDRFR